jgi:hypothetical protein
LSTAARKWAELKAAVAAKEEELKTLNAQLATAEKALRKLASA